MSDRQIAESLPDPTQAQATHFCPVHVDAVSLPIPDSVLALVYERFTQGSEVGMWPEAYTVERYVIDLLTRPSAEP